MASRDPLGHPAGADVQASRLHLRERQTSDPKPQVSVTAPAFGVGLSDVSIGHMSGVVPTHHRDGLDQRDLQNPHACEAGLPLLEEVSELSEATVGSARLQVCCPGIETTPYTVDLC